MGVREELELELSFAVHTGSISVGKRDQFRKIGCGTDLEIAETNKSYRVIIIR